MRHVCNKCVFVQLKMCVCACLYVCFHRTERETERERDGERTTLFIHIYLPGGVTNRSHSVSRPSGQAGLAQAVAMAAVGDHLFHLLCHCERARKKQRALEQLTHLFGEPPGTSLPSFATLFQVLDPAVATETRMLHPPGNHPGATARMQRWAKGAYAEEKGRESPSR